MNPSLSQHQHVFLLTSDKLYLNSFDLLGQNLMRVPTTATTTTSSASRSTSTSWSSTSAIPSSISTKILNNHFSNLLQTNKQWLIVPMPSNYLATNWPPRFAAVNDSGSLLAVAGLNGFCHYSLAREKWKFFGNEAQERDIAVSGGIFWWQDFLCASVYNIVDEKEEIRFYPRAANLDNVNASIHVIDTPTLLLNHMTTSSSSGILLLFGLDFRVLLYSFSTTSSAAAASDAASRSVASPAEDQTVVMTKLIQVSVENYVPHPSCVVAAYLSPFRVDDPTSAARRPSKRKREDFAQSLLLNICGKLLLFQCDDNSSPAPHSSLGSDGAVPFAFMAPRIIASCVESVWIPPRDDAGRLFQPTIKTSRAGQQYRPTHRSHLLESLWMGCGHVGLKLWLPLNSPVGRSVADADREDMFVSQRIIMTIPTQVYPLAILYEEGLIVGCVSRLNSLSSASSSPLWSVERKTQLYLPQILLYLLRQNLGRVGLKIVRPLQQLPYFSHVLELLLHEVLEEEGSHDTDEPLPDALLPKVLAFIKEFCDSYLRTIAHCARKTEMTLWPHLFAAVGSPTSLFDECLIRGDPDTASSYLLILQNLEKPAQSFHFATRLLNVVLNSKRWDLANDLVRFMKAIDPLDLDETDHSLERKTTPWSSPNEVVDPGTVEGTTASSSSLLETGVIVAPVVGAMSGGFPLAPTVSHCYASAAVAHHQHGRSPSPPLQSFGGGTGAQAVFDRRSSSLDFSNVLVATNNNEQAASCADELAHSPSQTQQQQPQHQQQPQQYPRPASRRHPSETTKLGRPKSRPGSLSVDTDLVASHHKFVENLLASHARFLLSEYRIRDLGMFAAHISPEDFQLLSWLIKCGSEELIIEDYVLALKRIHEDFNWPLPNYSHSAFVNILKRTPPTAAAAAAALFPQSQSEPNIALGSAPSSPGAILSYNSHPGAQPQPPSVEGARPQSAILVSAQASLNAMNQVLLAHSQSSSSSKQFIGVGGGGGGGGGGGEFATAAGNAEVKWEKPNFYYDESDSGTFCGVGVASSEGASSQRFPADSFQTLPFPRPSDPSSSSTAFAHPHTPLHAPDQFGSHTMEAFLRPQLPRDVSVNTALTSTDFSEESSSLMTDDGNGCLHGYGANGVEGSVSMLQASELYQLSQELSQKGPPQSELELRYLYQIYLEAGLLGWCFLIAVLLHDGFSVIRIINPSRMEELGPAGVANLRRGLDTLNQWAESGQCPGYKPFLTALKIHTTGIFANAANAVAVNKNGNNANQGGGGGNNNDGEPEVPFGAEEALTLERGMADLHLRGVDAGSSMLDESNVAAARRLRGSPTSRATSESDQSHVSTSKKNASASSVSTTRSRSSTPIAATAATWLHRDDCGASPELTLTLMPSPDDVLMTSATSSRGFDVRDDDDVNGNRRNLASESRLNVAVNSGESEFDDGND